MSAPGLIVVMNAQTRERLHTESAKDRVANRLRGRWVDREPRISRAERSRRNREYAEEQATYEEALHEFGRKEPMRST